MARGKDTRNHPNRRPPVPGDFNPVSSALFGAGVGALTGASFGPVGAAVGGAIGGVSGAVFAHVNNS